MDEYDEFGNFLGGEEEGEGGSEGFGEIEEFQDEIMQPASRAPAVEPLEGYDEDEEMQEPASTSQAIVLHEVRSLHFSGPALIFSNRRTNGTTLPLKTCMVQTWRRWCKRKTPSR
jgi:hypothetical protein